MATLKVKNWGEFQHYKDRDPPWIKLHKGLLDDYEYQRLPLASRALAPMIWLLASESKDGSVEYDLDKLSFRLRCTAKEIEEAIKPLIANGFLIADSELLAGCYQDAMPEESREEAEKEKEESKPRKRGSMTFLNFLDECKAKGEMPIPEDDPIFTFAEEAGIDLDWMRLAWLEFSNKYRNDSKRYADWRATFRNAIRGNWYKIWYCDSEGKMQLTSQGRIIQQVHKDAA